MTEEITATDLEARVAAHPFLAGMDKRHLDIFVRYLKPIRFEVGEMIFRAGEPATGFYLIETGAVSLEGSVMEHGVVTTDTVHAGEPLGWSWLFPPYRWHFDARAIEPTIAMYFDGESLRKHHEQDLTFSHDLFKRVSQVMVHRLQSARRKIVESRVENKRGISPVESGNPVS